MKKILSSTLQRLGSNQFKKVQFAATGLHFASLGRYIPHNNHCDPYMIWRGHEKIYGLIGEFYKSQHFAPIRSFFAVVSHLFFWVFFFGGECFFWFPSTPSMDPLQNRLVVRCASAKGRLKLTRFICRECPAKGHELISICVYIYKGNMFYTGYSYISCAGNILVVVGMEI